MYSVCCVFRSCSDLNGWPDGARVVYTLCLSGRPCAVVSPYKGFRSRTRACVFRALVSVSELTYLFVCELPFESGHVRVVMYK